MFDPNNLKIIIDIFSNSHNVYLITKYILILFLLIDAIELIHIIKSRNFVSIWSDKIIKQQLENYPITLKFLLKPFLLNLTFRFIPFINLSLAILLINYDYPSLFIIILYFRFIISIKFGGTFNGGSDSMIIVILIGLFISSLETQLPNLKSTSAGLIYIGLQSTISYLRAGMVKIKNPEWRNGVILPKFLIQSIYTQNKLDKLYFNYLSTNKYQISTLLCNFVIFWEILFPISLFNTNILFVFLLIGITFHIVNIYILGLNRFLIAWVATYPALIYLSLIIK